MKTLIVLFAATILALAGTSRAAEPPKPYPLAVCLVSDEALGSMGKPVTMVYEGQEIKFCCKQCVKQFKADPAKFLKKLQKAEKN